MSDQYGQQGQGGRPPQDGPTGWQPQPDQGDGSWQGKPQQGDWQGQPQQGWQGQPQQGGWQGQPQQGGWQGQPQQGGYPQQGPVPGAPQGPGGWQPQGTPPKKRNLGVLITAAVVVLALAAGLTIWLVSKKDGDSVAQGGKATPQAAASEMIRSLGQKDAVGVAEQLDPTEAKLFADLSGGILDQLKRLEIVKQEADANALVNGAITIADLTFEEGEGEKVSDNVTVVKLTGGKITVDESAMNLPFTPKIEAVVGSPANQGAAEPKTYDIAEEIKKNDGEPIRIATVQRGDKWYPSMFYTLADNWLQDAKKDNPELDSDALKAPITPIGGNSPEEAVQGLIDQAIKGDAEGVIGMLPPDEMGVLYDYGKRMLAAGGGSDLPTGELPEISDLAFYTTEMDGGVKVSLKSVTVAMQGQKVGVTIDPEAGTITVEQNGQSQVIQVEQALAMGLGDSADLPPEVAPIITKVVKKALTIGFVTTEVDGKWYVSPLRSFTGVFTTLLEGLEPGDIDTLLKLAGK